MWETVQVSVGAATHRGRFRVEHGQLVLEWRGGRKFESCGMLKPEVVAAIALKKLATRMPLAA